MFAAGWIIRGDRMVIADYSHGRAEGQYQYFLFLDGIDMMAQVRWPRAASHYRTATAGIGFGDTVPPGQGGIRSVSASLASASSPSATESVRVCRGLKLVATVPLQVGSWCRCPRFEPV